MILENSHTNRSLRKLNFFSLIPYFSINPSFSKYAARRCISFSLHRLISRDRLAAALFFRRLCQYLKYYRHKFLDTSMATSV